MPLSEAAGIGSLGISMLYYAEQLCQTVDSCKRNPQEKGGEDSFIAAVFS